MTWRRITLIASLALLISAILVTSTGAHPVTVSDGSRLDWFGLGPSGKNIGVLSHNTATQGEFVWADGRGDQRMTPTFTNNLTREIDLVRFNVTADTSNLYFLAKMDRINTLNVDQLPQILISIDTDHTASSGQTPLPGGANTAVNANAAWEYAIQTKFATRTTANQEVAVPALYDHSQTASACTGCNAQLVTTYLSGTPGSFIEIQVPWSSFAGGKPAPDQVWRFTVSTMYSAPVTVGDGSDSQVIDAISSVANTLGEVGDGTLDTYFDLHFDANGEIFSPLLISEFLPRPTYGGRGNDPAGEWIELYNPNSFSLNLKGYKIGDQLYRDTSGAGTMLQLPDYSLAGGAVVVIANDRSEPGSNRFQQQYPTVPASSIIRMSALQTYPAWGAGADITLRNRGINNGQPIDFRESVVLLDEADSISDLIQYATPGASQIDNDIKPITIPLTGVRANESFERCPAGRDTNSGSFDFLAHDPASLTNPSSPAPGQPCPPTTGVNLQITKTAPAAVLPGANVPYIINWYNIGSVGATNVVITDTLPLSITLVNTNPPASSVNGQTLTWNLGPVAPGASGIILVNGQLNPTAPIGRQFVNTAGISGAEPESPATLGDNFASAPVAVFAPDLSISSAGFPIVASPSQQFCYTINYGYQYGDDFGPIANVVISDTLPSGVTLVSQTAPAGWTFTPAQNNLLVWKLASLDNNTNGTINVCVQVDPSVVLGTTDQNTLVITGSADSDISNGSNNVETRALTFQVLPDLAVSLANAPTIASRGDTFSYTINYSNHGTGGATSATVTDVLPAGMKFVSQTAPGTTFSQTGNTLKWTFGALPVNTQGTITVNVQVSSAAVGGTSLTNSVTITSVPGEEPATLTDNSADATVFIRHAIYMPITRA
jgi:uncharacterized repeat protein (TIGR01451 family)